jgi:hypothetical protein
MLLFCAGISVILLTFSSWWQDGYCRAWVRCSDTIPHARNRQWVFPYALFSFWSGKVSFQISPVNLPVHLIGENSISWLPQGVRMSCALYLWTGLQTRAKEVSSQCRTPATVPADHWGPWMPLLPPVTSDYYGQDQWRLKFSRNQRHPDNLSKHRFAFHLQKCERLLRLLVDPWMLSTCPWTSTVGCWYHGCRYFSRKVRKWGGAWVLLFLLFLVGLGFELGASYLQSRCSTAWDTTAVHFCSGYFGDGVSWTSCWSQPPK